jgi:hypothetical protein
MGCIWVPQTRGRKAVSAYPMACTPHALMGKARRQDLGAPLQYQWRERAKLLEGRVAAAAAHVGCCVLCCVVCCDLSKFIYHPDSNTISAKSKWPIFACSYHKIGPKHPKYNWMYNLVIIQRCCTCFDFMGQKCVGCAMSVQKSGLKFS